MTLAKLRVRAKPRHATNGTRTHAHARTRTRALLRTHTGPRVDLVGEMNPLKSLASLVGASTRVAKTMESS